VNPDKYLILKHYRRNFFDSVQLGMWQASGEALLRIKPESLDSGQLGGVTVSRTESKNFRR